MPCHSLCPAAGRGQLHTPCIPTVRPLAGLGFSDVHTSGGLWWLSHSCWPAGWPSARGTGRWPAGAQAGAVCTGLPQSSVVSSSTKAMPAMGFVCWLVNSPRVFIVLHSWCTTGDWYHPFHIDSGAIHPAYGASFWFFCDGIRILPRTILVVLPVNPIRSKSAFMESPEELVARIKTVHINVVACDKVTWLHNGHDNITGQAMSRSDGAFAASVWSPLSYSLTQIKTAWISILWVLL